MPLSDWVGDASRSMNPLKIHARTPLTLLHGQRTTINKREALDKMQVYIYKDQVQF